MIQHCADPFSAIISNTAVSVDGKLAYRESFIVCRYYWTATTAPASSSFALTCSASSLEIPSFTA